MDLLESLNLNLRGICLPDTLSKSDSRKLERFLDDKYPKFKLDHDLDGILCGAEHDVEALKNFYKDLQRFSLLRLDFGKDYHFKWGLHPAEFQKRNLYLILPTGKGGDRRIPQEIRFIVDMFKIFGARYDFVQKEGNDSLSDLIYNYSPFKRCQHGVICISGFEEYQNPLYRFFISKRKVINSYGGKLIGKRFQTKMRK